MGPAPWAQQLLTLLAPHLLKPPGEQDQDQDPPTQVWLSYNLTIFQSHLLKPPGEQEDQDPPTQVW